MIDFTDLKEIIYASYPDAHIKRVYFEDECECLSEVTLDPCQLDIDIITSISAEYNRENTEAAIQDWADAQLNWQGCDFCEHGLYINLNFYPGKYQSDWMSPKPILRHLNNANLYTGQEAIDKILEMYDSGLGELGELVVFVAHMGDWKGYRDSFFITHIRKIDKYPDHITLYTNVGVLPIYPENPISTNQIIEAIEIPHDYEQLIRMYLEMKRKLREKLDKIEKEAK